MEIVIAVFAGVTAVANMAAAYAAYRRQHHQTIQTGRIDNYTAAHQGYNMQLMLQQVPDFSYKHLLPQAHDGAPPHGRYDGGAPNYLRSASAASAMFRLGGNLQVVDVQRAPDTYQDRRIGLQTGRHRMFDYRHAQAHWQEFQHGQVCTPTIAVVNWTAQTITMYIMYENWYFRSYHVSNCNLEAFAREKQNNMVFSGILTGTCVAGTRAGSLHGALDSPFKVVEDDGWCNVRSSNCWSLLGVPGSVGGFGQLVFVEMMRAAVFGLIQCRFDDPTLLNVDMVGDHGFESVHVDSHVTTQLRCKPDCCFSVFSFITGGWAEQRVLVG